MEYMNIPPKEPEHQPEDAVYYVEETVVMTPDAGTQMPPAAPQPPAQKKKPWNKRILIAVAAAVIVVALLVIALASAVGNSPMKLVADSIGNTLDSVGENELLTVAQKAGKGGSVSVECGMFDLADVLVYGVYGDETDGRAAVKAYTDLPNGKLALRAQAAFGGEDVHAGFYVNKESLAISMPELLDETYGVNIKSLADTLPRSVFAPDSGSNFAMEEETFEQLLQQQLDGDAFQQNEALAKQTGKTLEKLLSEFLKNVEQYAKVEKLSGEVLFVDSSAKTTIVSVRVNGEALEKICRNTLQWAYSSKDVRKTAEAVCEQYGAQIASMTGSGADATELCEQFYDELYDWIDACDELEYAWEDTALKLDFHITKSGKRLVKLNAQLQQGADKTKLLVTMGPTLGDPELIRVQYESAWETFDAAFTVEENTSKQYSAKFRVKQDEETSVKASVSWDKKAGDLRVKYEDAYDMLLVKGSLLADRKSVELHIRSVTFDEDILRPDLTFTILASDEMPEMPAYTEVLLLSEEELVTLGLQIQSDLMELLE